MASLPEISTPETSLQPPIGPVRTGCLCCPPKPEAAPLDWDPDPGFGAVYFMCDGKRVSTYMLHDDEESGCSASMTVQDFEDRAAGDPDHDWRFEIHGPLGGVVYQRHGEAMWYAIKRLDGFA